MLSFADAKIRHGCGRIGFPSHISRDELTLHKALIVRVCTSSFPIVVSAAVSLDSRLLSARSRCERLAAKTTPMSAPVGERRVGATLLVPSTLSHSTRCLAAVD